MHVSLKLMSAEGDWGGSYREEMVFSSKGMGLS